MKIHKNEILISFVFIGAFEDSDVIHVDGEVDPIRDLETISEELRLKDEEYLLANLDKLEKLVVRGGDKKGKPEYVSSSTIFSFHSFSGFNR